MPIHNNIIKIDPRDQDPSVADIGIAFPLNEINMFKGTTNVKEQLKTNIINVLLTEPGERLHLPTFGLGLKKLLFSNNIDLNILKENIQTQLSMWVPTIRLMNVNVNVSEDRHTFKISIGYSYVLDGSSDGIELIFR
jgi:phage baseplate assembly protein W